MEFEETKVRSVAHCVAMFPSLRVNIGAFVEQ